MHYWFVESENAPDTDPLAFWTNGGPGCSGMIGFLTEQGNIIAHMIIYHLFSF
jgi:carboxypeptidase C (cathepsin A)